ncbi:MAG: class I SAM-dependent methyltransferase [Chloroflexi bacterium]|nr:class I SAM-dependent methyltransferase [Chloroflexota bacterium]
MASDPERWPYAADYNDPLMAALYDAEETDTQDIALLRRLIAAWRPAGALLHILECFSGTGRILVPLVADGHRVTGIEMAPAMRARAQAKVDALGAEARCRTTLRVGDVLAGEWGAGYDLVILGGNCLYELPDPDAQERCIALAARALAPGGRLYVDNDDYHGQWAGPQDRELRTTFEGCGPDGSYGRAERIDLAFDDHTQVLTMLRRWYVRRPDGSEVRREYVSRKHPVTAAEARAWLDAHGLQVVGLYGDWQGTPHAAGSPRAIFWAEKPRD